MARNLISVLAMLDPNALDAIMLPALPQQPVRRGPAGCLTLESRRTPSGLHASLRRGEGWVRGEVVEVTRTGLTLRYEGPPRHERQAAIALAAQGEEHPIRIIAAVLGERRDARGTVLALRYEHVGSAGGYDALLRFLKEHTGRAKPSASAFQLSTRCTWYSFKIENELETQPIARRTTAGPGIRAGMKPIDLPVTVRVHGVAFRGRLAAATDDWRRVVILCEDGSPSLMDIVHIEVHMADRQHSTRFRMRGSVVERGSDCRRGSFTVRVTARSELRRAS